MERKYPFAEGYSIPWPAFLFYFLLFAWYEPYGHVWFSFYCTFGKVQAAMSWCFLCLCSREIPCLEGGQLHDTSCHLTLFALFSPLFYFYCIYSESGKQVCLKLPLFINMKTKVIKGDPHTQAQ